MTYLSDPILSVKVRDLHKVYLYRLRKERVSIEDIMNLLNLDKRKKAQRYLEALEWFTSRYGLRKLNYEEFKKIILDHLDSEFKLSDLIKAMSEKSLPLNYYSVLRVSREKNIKLNRRTARSLLRLARELEIVDVLKITVYTPSIQEKILNYLRNNGEVKYFRLETKFPDLEKIIVELWQQGIIEIDALEKFRDHFSNLDLFKVPIGYIKQISASELFTMWEDPISGEKYGTLVIPPTTWVRIR